MKCARCGDYKETVGEVRKCAGCDDGTVKAIPVNMEDDALLADAVAASEGLGNRFKPGSLAVEADPEPETEQQETDVIKPQKEGVMGKVKRAYKRATGKK